MPPEAPATPPTETATTEPTTPPEGTPAPTPRTFDEDYVKGIRSESAGYRTSLRAKEQEVTDLTSRVQAFEAEKPALETRATTAELTAQRYEIALEKGLTIDLAKRLIGATRDEMVADADALLAALGNVTPPADLGQGPRTPPAAPKPGVNDALRVLASGRK